MGRVVSDACRVRAANPAQWIQRTIMHLMIGIEDNRYDFLLEEPQVNLEIVIVMAYEP